MSYSDDDDNNSDGRYAPNERLSDDLSEEQREIIDSYFDVYNNDDMDDNSGGGGAMIHNTASSGGGAGGGRRNRKNDELLQTMDKGFAILDAKSKNPIAYFHTDSNPGSTIRNAVTGQYESGFKFGSINEDLFFKVGQASPTDSRMHMLFYDTPEQFEKHFRTTLSQAVKTKWSEKSTRRRLDFNDRPPLTSLATVVK